MEQQLKFCVFFVWKFLETNTGEGWRVEIMEQRPPNSISNLLCRRLYTHRQIIANNISFENNFVFVFWRPYTLGELYDMDENCCLWIECCWKWMKIVKHWMKMYFLPPKSQICIFEMPCPKRSLFFFSLVFQQWMEFSIYNSGLSGQHSI